MQAKPSKQDGGTAAGPSIHDITGNLAIMFKDEVKRGQVMKLLGPDPGTMDNLIKAAAAWLLVDELHVDYPGDGALAKASNLYAELKQLVGPMMHEEIAIQERVVAYTLALFDLLVNTPAIKQPGKKHALLSTFEDDLVETFRTVPEYYFFDFLESLVDVEAMISRDRAWHGREGTHAHEGEIFSFNKFRHGMIEFLDIPKLEALEVLYQPIRKLARDVYVQKVDALPVSKRGIDAFHEASKLKQEILSTFKGCTDDGETLDEVQGKIHDLLYGALREQAKDSPNDVLYFLQNLLGMPFDRLVSLLKENGITDLSLFVSALSVDYDAIEYRFNEKGIERHDIEQLIKYEGNMTSFAQLSIDDYKREQRGRGVPASMLDKIELTTLVEDHLGDLDNPALDFVCKDLNLSCGELVDLLLLETNAKGIVKDFNLKSMSQLVMLLKMQEFIDNIAREVFLSVLMRLTKQISRIIEFFLLLSSVKEEIASSIARLRQQLRMKPRELVQHQDTLVSKIMHLQDNVSYILDKKDPYEVNAFIHGKLVGITLAEAREEIKTGNSAIYFDVVEHPIILDDLDVVSRISALDLLFRAQLREKRDAL